MEDEIEYDYDYEKEMEMKALDPITPMTESTEEAFARQIKYVLTGIV
ncbi:MAG: hypothetical protein GY817_02250 [bacterium]|nr:hypothetical protein [bacterium]